MTDETLTTEAPTPTPPSPATTQPGPTRTPEGTIKDQTTGQTPPTSAPTSTKEASSTTTPAEGESPFNKSAAQGAPDKYEDFKVPEGYTLDETMSKEATELFKGMNLSQAQAQQLVDLYVKRTTEAFEAPFKAYVDMKKAWTDEVMKSYGKDIEPGGKHFRSVGNLLANLGPDLEPAFREAMDVTGVGSHPAFVRAFIKLAELLGEGTPTAQGRGPSPLGQTQSGAVERPSAAAAIYPHLPNAG